MMFMITMPPTTSEIPAMAIMAMKNVPLRFDPQAQEVLIGLDRKAVGLAGLVMPARAQNGARLVDGSIQLAADAVGFARDDDAGVQSVLLQKGADRNQNVIVAALAQGLALLLAHADHAVDLAFERGVPCSAGPCRKKVVHQVGADDRDVGSGCSTSVSLIMRP